MANLKAKKAELLNFIKYKCKWREDVNDLLKTLKKLSYAKLRDWAIANDIIDVY